MNILIILQIKEWKKMPLGIANTVQKWYNIYVI